MSRQSIRPVPLQLASAPHPGQITILMPQAAPLVNQRVLSGLVILPPVGVLPREGGWGVILGKNMFHCDQLVHCLLPPPRRNGHTSPPRRLIPPTYLEINAIQLLPSHRGFKQGEDDDDVSIQYGTDNKDMDLSPSLTRRWRTSLEREHREGMILMKA
jgi:hypothetical protein